MILRNTTAQAMVLMLASMMCFGAMNNVISVLGEHMHSTQMVLVRNTLSLCFVLLLAASQQKRIPRFPTKRLGGHLGRAAAGLFAMQLWFYSMTIMPVTLATALSFTTPIFATIAAIILLGEHAGWRRWSAMLVSFFGVMMILRPDVNDVSLNVLYVLISSAAMAIAGTFVKSLSRTEPPETIVFYMALFMAPLSLPLGVMHWRAPLPDEWIMLVIIALLSTAAQLMMARAYKRAQMVVLLPLDFTRLVFTSAIAYVWTGEILDAHGWVGAAIIVISTLYITHRETQAGKKAAAIKIAGTE